MNQQEIERSKSLQEPTRRLQISCHSSAASSLRKGRPAWWCAANPLAQRDAIAAPPSRPHRCMVASRDLQQLAACLIPRLDQALLVPSFAPQELWTWRGRSIAALRQSTRVSRRRIDALHVETHRIRACCIQRECCPLVGELLFIIDLTLLHKLRQERNMVSDCHTLLCERIWLFNHSIDSGLEFASRLLPACA